MKKLGNMYLFLLQTRNGTTTSGTKVIDGLPFNLKSGACVNCFYGTTATGGGIQVKKNSIILIENAPSSNIIASFFALPE